MNRPFFGIMVPFPNPLGNLNQERKISMSFERIGIRPTQILLPAPGVRPETWACIACDQYTSEPAYWEKAFATAGDSPSALKLILPECNLKDSEKLIPGIHRTMAEYLEQGLLVPAVDPGFILWHAVRGMMPKNRLSRIQIKRLKLYPGADHPHAAQNPQAL